MNVVQQRKKFIRTAIGVAGRRDVFHNRIAHAGRLRWQRGIQHRDIMDTGLDESVVNTKHSLELLTDDELCHSIQITLIVSIFQEVFGLPQRVNNVLNIYERQTDENGKLLKAQLPVNSTR
jgi:hypothetical protein